MMYYLKNIELITSNNNSLLPHEKWWIEADDIQLYFKKKYDTLITTIKEKEIQSLISDYYTEGGYEEKLRAINCIMAYNTFFNQQLQ